jgi:hypothetical protein
MLHFLDPLPAVVQVAGVPDVCTQSCAFGFMAIFRVSGWLASRRQSLLSVPSAEQVAAVITCHSPHSWVCVPPPPPVEPLSQAVNVKMSEIMVRIVSKKSGLFSGNRGGGGTMICCLSFLLPFSCPKWAGILIFYVRLISIF